MKLPLSKVVPGVSYAIGTSTDVTEDDTVKTALAADAVDRAVIVVATCTEDVTADYDSPTFEVGTDGERKAGSLIPTSVLAGATEGDVFIGAGLVPAGEAVIVTVVDSGTPGDTGAFTVVVLAGPTA